MVKVFLFMLIFVAGCASRHPGPTLNSADVHRIEYYRSSFDEENYVFKSAITDRETVALLCGLIRSDYKTPEGSVSDGFTEELRFTGNSGELIATANIRGWSASPSEQASHHSVVSERLAKVISEIEAKARKIYLPQDPPK